MVCMHLAHDVRNSGAFPKLVPASHAQGLQALAAHLPAVVAALLRALAELQLRRACLPVRIASCYLWLLAAFVAFVPSRERRLWI